MATSDLARAVGTASPLARALGVELLLCPGLRELDLGLWTGLTRAEIAARDGEALARFEAGDDAPAGAAESRADLARRAGSSLAALCSRHPGRRIAVVTHLGVIRALLGRDLDHAAWRWAPALA